MKTKAIYSFLLIMILGLSSCEMIPTLNMSNSPNISVYDGSIDTSIFSTQDSIINSDPWVDFSEDLPSIFDSIPEDLIIPSIDINDYFIEDIVFINENIDLYFYTVLFDYVLDATLLDLPTLLYEFEVNKKYFEVIDNSFSYYDGHYDTYFMYDIDSTVNYLTSVFPLKDVNIIDYYNIIKGSSVNSNYDLIKHIIADLPSEKDYYVSVFNPDNGEAPKVIVRKKDESVSYYEEPFKQNYKFVGWVYDNNRPYNENDVNNAHQLIKAIYEDDGTHTHLFSDELSFDEKYHYYDSLCGHKETINYVEHNLISSGMNTIGQPYNKVITSCSECNYSYESYDPFVIVNYYNDAKEFIKMDTLFCEVNEQYHLEVPSNEFAMPNRYSVDGILNEKGNIEDVYYTFNTNTIDTVEKGMKYDLVPVSYQNGVSISFIIDNNDSYDYELFKTEHITIYPGKIRYNGNYNSVNYYLEWNTYMSDGYNDIINDNGNTLFTYSFNNDGSVKGYVNGKLTFDYQADKKADEYSYLPTQQIYEDIDADSLYKNIISDLNYSGFITGQDIEYRSLKIDNAFTDDDALRYYEFFKKVTVKHLNKDDLPNKLAEDSIYLVLPQQFYLFYPKKFDEYVCTNDVAHYDGMSDNTTIKFYYYSLYEEVNLSGDLLLDKKNESGWIDEEQWIKLGEYDNDFSFVVEYNLNSGNDFWMSSLFIIYDLETGDRVVSRADNYGWQEDLNGDGKTLGNIRFANYDVFSSDFLSIIQDCKVILKVTRNSNIVNLDYKFISLDGKTIEFRCVISDVNVNNLSLALTCEFSKVEVIKAKIKK